MRKREKVRKKGKRERKREGQREREKRLNEERLECGRALCLQGGTP